MGEKSQERESVVINTRKPRRHYARAIFPYRINRPVDDVRRKRRHRMQIVPQLGNVY